MQLSVLSQTRHGVVASSKGRLNRGVAIAGVLFHVVLKRQRHRPALGVRNLQAGSSDTRPLWALLGHSTHFVDEFLAALAKCDNEKPDPNFPQKSPEDKAKVSGNAWTGSRRVELRELSKMVNAEVRVSRELVRGIS